MSNFHCPLSPFYSYSIAILKVMILIRVSNVSSLKAAIAETCTTTINFEDLNQNVYAYRADDFFYVPSVQAGGHSDQNEATDLGANIFAMLPVGLNLEGNYDIDGASGLPGTAYIFYHDRFGNVYISSDNNTARLSVTQVQFSEDGLTVERLAFSFNNVEVINNYDAEDILCINAFELVYYE